MPASWRCTCGAYNAAVARFCEQCGRERLGATESAEESTLPAYQRFPERPQGPLSQPSDACSEPGCTLTVAEHIAEFKAAGRRIQARSVAL